MCFGARHVRCHFDFLKSNPVHTHTPALLSPHTCWSRHTWLRPIEQVRMVTALAKLHQDIEQPHFLYPPSSIHNVNVLQKNPCVPGLCACVCTCVCMYTCMCICYDITCNLAHFKCCSASIKMGHPIFNDRKMVGSSKTG